MSSSSSLKLTAKILPVVAGILLLAGALVSFLSMELSLLLLGLGSLFALGSGILRQKQSIHDTRTVIRQELRSVNVGSSHASDKTMREASTKLAAVAEKISREQSPVARELHLKTVEEIRFLQAQISEFMKNSHRG